MARQRQAKIAGTRGGHNGRLLRKPAGMTKLHEFWFCIGPAPDSPSELRG
jgi:hypothetical protein